MSGSAYASVYLDRDSDVFSVIVDYYIEGYNDPETGEYFGDTSWSYWLTNLDSNTGGGSGGYASEGDSVYIDFGIEAQTALGRWTIDFNALNTFSGVTAALSLTVLTGAGVSDALAVDGTAGIDVIIGGAGNDTLSGLDGNDFIEAGAGADLLAAGAGADTLDGGVGADTLNGGSGNDSYRVDAAGDVVLELLGEGYDTVYARTSHTLAGHLERLVLEGIDALDGAGNALGNVIDGNAAANLLAGAAGHDLLSGNGGADRLLGGTGADTLVGGAGQDTLLGGAGDDTYRIDADGDRIVELPGGGSDVVEGSGLAVYLMPVEIEGFVTRTLPGQVLAIRVQGNDLGNAIAGAAAADTLLGGEGDDTLTGGEGTDLLIGAAGHDRLEGGLDADTASYADSGAAVEVRLDTGQGLGGDAQGDTLLAVENLVGSAFDDALRGDGQANRLVGGAGADTIDGGAGNDTVLGGAGADVLTGGAGGDLLSYAGSAGGLVIDLLLQQVSGGDAAGDAIAGFEHAAGTAGDDTLTGSAQPNRLSGGAGDDLIEGGGGADTLAGGAGADTLAGGAGHDTLSYASSAGAVAVDLRADAQGLQAVGGDDAEGDVASGFRDAIGGSGDDTLTGGATSNALIGGDGDDLIRGQSGDDTLSGGAGADTLRGGLGRDTLSFASSQQGVAISLGSGTSGGDAAGDVFSGFEDLIGGFGNDYLVGDDGGNRLQGGAGFDSLNGRLGDDTLTGGADGDAFYLFDVIGNDLITDFGGTDILVPGLGADFDSFEEIMAVASASGAGGEHTLFDFGALGTLLVLDTAIGSFTEDSFLF